jgi:hypothetical protein
VVSRYAGITCDFFVQNLYVDRAICGIVLDHDPALCGIAQDLDQALYEIVRNHNPGLCRIARIKMALRWINLRGVKLYRRISRRI